MLNAKVLIFVMSIFFSFSLLGVDYRHFKVGERVTFFYPDHFLTLGVIQNINLSGDQKSVCFDVQLSYNIEGVDIENPYVSPHTNLCFDQDQEIPVEKMSKIQNGVMNPSFTPGLIYPFKKGVTIKINNITYQLARVLFLNEARQLVIAPFSKRFGYSSYFRVASPSNLKSH